MYPTGRQYIVYVPGIIENRTAVPSTGGKCVEYDSISIRYMYELIGALASMCHDMACFPQLYSFYSCVVPPTGGTCIKCDFLCLVSLYKLICILWYMHVNIASVMHFSPTTKIKATCFWTMKTYQL